MASAIFSGFAIYFVFWWLTLFLTLPFGVRSQHEVGDHAPGTDPGAPVMALMRRKIIWTTIVSLILYGIASWAYYSGLLNVVRLSGLMGFSGY
jgi:predicted secreted protein